MKLKKIISLMLAIVMLPIGQLVFAATGEATGGSRAGWFIDAESDITATVISDEGAIGGGAVEGEFTVNFVVPEEKNYYLHARAKATSGSGSIAYKFGTDEAAVSSITCAAGEYTWIKISDAKALAAGENSVTVQGSDGVKIDGIIVSELETLPVSATVSDSKALFAEELELPGTYPDIFDEKAANTDIAFEAGDRVLFLGDSITHAAAHGQPYNAWIFTYYSTRYPDSEFTYINGGRAGDTTENALKRLVSDINIHDYNKIVVMLGTNDVNRNTWYGHRDDQDACDEVIEKYITNIDILLKNFSDKEIILMGPTCWNEFSSQSASTAEIVEGYNSEIRRVNNYLKDYAYDNNIPYIDLNTSLTKAMIYYTEKNPSYAALYGTNDRTHPGELGHYIMAYNFLKAQGQTSEVATSDINASTSTASVKNAQVKDINATTTSVSYKYKPSSLPIPADSYYREIQKLIPIDDELNREIIKVTGLTDGSYSVKMNGNVVLQNVSSKELADGINIADLKNNPNQQRALAVKGIIDKRSVIERANIRDFRQTEYSALTKSSNGLTYTMTYDELIAQASKKSDLASYVKQKKALYNYFGAVDYYEKLIYSINKPEEVEITIERMGDLEDAASFTRSYTTEQVSLNEGSPEIVFKDKTTVSNIQDFTVTDGSLTAYSGNAENVYIPANVTEIKAGAFKAGAKYVYVPSGVNKIEAGAFKNLEGADVCFSLNGFLNENITYETIDYVTYSDDSLLYYNPTSPDSSYTVPYEITSISDYAFANAKNLTEVIIPNTVKEIGEDAFYNTNLTVKCYKNTAAYEYVVANSLDYEIIPFSDNAKLESISFNGAKIVNFDPEKTEYDIKLFASTGVVNIEAVAQEAVLGATVEIENNGATVPCTITVSVTAQDKTTTNEYTLNFTEEEAISNFSKYGTTDTAIKQLRLDNKRAVYATFDERNQFLLNAENTSDEFGYGVVIQRYKGDANEPTYDMPFYSNSGDPLLGAADGRYWYSFTISEAATVYVGVFEGKTWENGENNGWMTDTSGLKLYGMSGTQLYKRHFNAGIVNIPSFGAHASYAQSPTTRVEWNPSVYAIIFDSSIATEETANAAFSVTRATIGSTNLSEDEGAAPKLDRDTAYDSLIAFEGTAPEGESVSMIITPENDDSTLIAVGQTTASALGIFSFDALPGEDIAPGVTYKAEITSSKGEKYTYYFKTIDEARDISVTVNPEVSKYFMGTQVGEDNFYYADTRLGEREEYTGSIIIHKTEKVDGVVTPVKEGNTYVVETVSKHMVGVQFSSERPLHRVGLAGNAFKGLNHIAANQNTTPGRMKSALNSVKEFTWEGSPITLDQMYNKYCDFYGGNNVFYTFTPDEDGTVYVALPYENPYYTQQGWNYMLVGTDDVAEGYSEWRVVPESTYFSKENPYQLAKFQHDSNRTNVTFYNHVYYRSFEAGEEVDIYTGGVNYADASSEAPKTIIRWGEHLSTDTDFELTYNGKTENISSNRELVVLDETATLSAKSTKGARVVLSDTKINAFPKTVTATVTAAAGNTKTYELIIDRNIVSTKIGKVKYKIDGISETFEVDGFDGSCGNEFSISLPHGDVKSKMALGIESVTASIEIVDDMGSYEISPSNGVLDFSQNGRADMIVTVTDGLGNKESFVLHFSIPVYNIETKGRSATLRKIYGENQISGYEGFSVGENTSVAGPLSASVFAKDAYVITRYKGEAGDPTKDMPFYGGATYNSDETGWWLTFKVTDDSYVYVFDREGWGWPNKDENYWSKATDLNTKDTYYVHFAKAGETVKIPNYGYSTSWETGSETRLTKNPSNYIVMPVESAKFATFTATAVAGGITIKANGESYICEDSSTIEFRQGTQIELVAEDNGNFMHWVEAATGRIISTDISYTFTIGSDRAINAIYRDEAEDGVYYVMFKNINEKILAAGYTSANVYAPQDPYTLGYSFAGWYIAGKKTEIKENDDVSQFGFTKDTVIQAGFEVLDKKYNVYFENQSTTEPYGTYSYNDKITLTAPEAEKGKVFVYWMRDGQIVSYNSVYTFIMGISDVSVKAVYDDEAVDETALIVMSKPVVLTGENRISFMAERSVPEGYKLIESGILLSPSAGITMDNAKYKAISTSDKAKGQFTFRKAGLSNGDKWYGRAYLIYEYENQVFTIYSNEESATYTE